MVTQPDFMMIGVYHKRRTDFGNSPKQVYQFGCKTNSQPKTSKICKADILVSNYFSIGILGWNHSLFCLGKWADSLWTLYFSGVSMLCL
jgi:hypothetical protein